MMIRAITNSGPTKFLRQAGFLFCLLLTSGVFAQLLEYDTRISAEPGKLIKEESVLIRVTDKSWDWLSDVSIHYLGEDEIDILEATLLDGQGKFIRSISKKEIVTRHDISEGTFFSNEWVKEFKAVGPGYPYQIRYRYRTARKKFTQIAHWYPMINTSVSTLKATLSITSPRDYLVLIDQSGDPSYDSVIQSNKITRSWTYGRIGPIKEQAFAPPVPERIPHVWVAPVRFDYVVEGSYSSWKEYGKWEAALVEGTEDLPQDEKYVVARLLEGARTPDEKTRRLYHYVQDNTRYVAVEVDEGGFKPLPASFVSTKKYGDCKALVVYLKALLKAFDIPSHYSPVYGGPNPVRGAKKVHAQWFNHVILCVPVDGDTAWIEATAGHLPYRYLGTFTQGRETLVVDGAESKLVKTPALRARDVLNHDQYHFTLNREGGGNVSVNRTFRGPEFQLLRSYQHNKLTRETGEYLRYTLPLQDYQVVDQHFSPFNRDSSFLKFDLTASVANQFRKLGETSALSPPRFALPSFEIPSQRTSSVRFNYPVYKTAEISYTIELGKDQLITVPESTTHSSDYGIYSVVYSQKSSTITLKKSLLLYAGEYSLDQYPSLYSFLESIAKTEKQPILINPTSR